MRSRATEVQAIDRHRVTSPAGHRPHEQDLVQCDLALGDGAFGQPELLLEVDRRHHLTAADVVGEPRYHATDDGCHTVGQ